MLLFDFSAADIDKDEFGNRLHGINVVEELFSSLQQAFLGTHPGKDRLSNSWNCKNQDQVEQILTNQNLRESVVLFVETEPTRFPVGSGLKTSAVEGVNVFYGLINKDSFSISSFLTPPYLCVMNGHSRIAELKVDHSCYDQIASALSGTVKLTKNIFEMSAMEQTVRYLQRIRFLSVSDTLSSLMTDDEIELLINAMKETASDDVSALVEAFLREKVTNEEFITRAYQLAAKIKAKKLRRKARTQIINKIRTNAAVDGLRVGIQKSTDEECTVSEECETTETEQEESFERLSTLEIAPFTDQDEVEDGHMFSQFLKPKRPSGSGIPEARPAIASLQKGNVNSGSMGSEERRHHSSDRDSSMKSMEQKPVFYGQVDASNYRDSGIVRAMQSPWARGFMQSYINRTLTNSKLLESVEKMVNERDPHLRMANCRLFEETCELIVSQKLASHGLTLKSLEWLGSTAQSQIEQNFETNGDLEVLVADVHRRMKAQSNPGQDRKFFNRQHTCPHEFYKPDMKTRSVYGMDLEQQIRSREQLERLNMKVFYHKKDALISDPPVNRGSGGRIIDTTHFDPSSGIASGTKYQHVYSPQNYKPNKFNTTRTEVSSGTKPIKSMLEPVTPNSGGNPRHAKRNSVDLYNSKRGWTIMGSKQMAPKMGLHADVESDEESSSILSSMSPLHRSRSRMTLEFPHHSVFDKQLSQFYKSCSEQIIKLTKKVISDLSSNWEFNSQELANLHKIRQQPIEFFQWLSKFRSGTSLAELVKIDGFCDCLVAEHSATLEENANQLSANENYAQADKHLFDKFVAAEMRNLFEKEGSAMTRQQLALERLVYGSNFSVLGVFEVWLANFDDRELLESLNIAHRAVFSNGNNIRLNLHKAKENSDDSSDDEAKPPQKSETKQENPSPSENSKPIGLSRLKSGVINKPAALDLKDTDSYPMATHGTAGAKNHMAGVSELMNSPDSKLRMMNHSSMNTEKGSLNARISAIDDMNGSPVNPMRSPGLAPSLISPNERGGWDSPGKDSIVLESKAHPTGHKLVLQLQQAESSPSNKIGTLNSLGLETHKSGGVGTSRTVQSHQDYSDMFQLLPCVTKTKDMKFEFFMNNIFAKMKNEYGMTQHQYFQFIKEVSKFSNARRS